MDVTPSDFPDIRWHGHWIWLGDQPAPMGSPFGWDRAPRPEAHGLFRRAFDLGTVPARVPARITADSRYQLWVNGQRAGYGPARSQARRLSYDLYDLAPLLRVGRNVIAVHVKYFGAPKSDWAPAVANATLGKSGVLVFEADLGASGGWLVSDATWQARLGRGWKGDAHDPHLPEVVAGVPVESYDARDEVEDWPMPDHDAAGWGAARVITPVHIGGRGRSQPPADPYGPLLPRGTAMTGGAICRPVAVTAQAVAAPDLAPPNPAERVERAVRGQPMGQAAALPLTGAAPAVVRLDMGRIVTGFVELALHAPAGTTFDLHFTDEPIGPPGPFGAHGGARYVADGQPARHRLFDRKGFRFAYLLIHGPGHATITDVLVQEDHYPWTGDAAFTCSDPDLTRLYAAGRRTVEVNSWDAFIDCPSREQRAWTGDAVVHQMVHLATNADWRLAGRYLELSNSPRPDGILPMSVAGDVEAGEGFTIPDWSLHWVHGVWNWHRFTGDREAVKALMPTAERILRWYLPFLNRAGRLQDVVEWNLVDWSALYSQDESAIVTALWARGLAEFAEMATWLGEAASRAWAEALTERVRAGFELFWDEARGTYVDHAVQGVAQAPVNQLAGALAIVSGLAPRDRWARIIETITDARALVVRSWMFPAAGAPPEEAGLRFRRMITGGLVPDWDVAQQIVLAEPFMSYVVHDAVAAAGRQDLLPGLLARWQGFLTGGYDTFGENWGTGTRSHGWSSTPTRDLIWHVLGVTPQVPGFATARVAPRPGALAWLRGRVPTPFGMIAVDCADGQVTVTSPVPIVLALEGRAEEDLPAGRHQRAV